MANKSKENLFKRLTRLFRGGPIVRRKIRSLDTVVAGPDKMSSSGVALFQKSTSPTYANITANAYNLSERLMRYQDFQEMEYSVHGGQLIATPESPDGFKKIEDLAAECLAEPGKTFIVYSYDHEKKQIVPAIGHAARQTCVDHAWRIKFDNDKEVIASAEHRLMLRDGTYRKVEDLQRGDAMMPFYRKDLFENATEGTKGYRWIYTMDKKFHGWTKEHQLIAEWAAERELLVGEVVHHINFVKTDNRPENLRIMTESDHNSYHASLNNDAKWAPENQEWIEKFKKNHAIWMRDNAPTRRRDVTFARIVEVCERVGFSISKACSALDITKQLLNERLVAHGFKSFSVFAEAYRHGSVAPDQFGRPGVMTRDLSLELIKALVTANDTKRSLAIKLNCTVNVLDKFLSRRVNLSWSQLREQLGYSLIDETDVVRNHRKGGRKKGSWASKSELTFKQICDAFEPGLTLPRLASKMGANKNTVISRLAQNGFNKYSDFASQYENCKVVSIEYVGVIPLYDLTVDGYKNFATDSVISHNTPELAAALDIYADEVMAQDEKGRVLHVYSDNPKIKVILDDLYYNILNIEFNGRSWVRNLPVHKDTVIPLLDGRNITIEQLAQEHNEGKENWVYSVQDKTLRMVPGKVAWCGLTRKDSELVRVWLDDGTYVDCTPDHEWVLRDGTQKRADELTRGESLMPLYRRSGMRSGKKGYEWIYDPGTSQWRYTHRVMPLHKWKKSDIGKIVHHINFDRSDNRPSNLCVMSIDEHVELHRKAGNTYNNSDLHKQHNVQRSAAMKKLWSDKDRRVQVSTNMAIKFDEQCIELLIKRLGTFEKYVSPKTLGNVLKSDEEFMGHFRAINEGTHRDLTKALNSHSGIENLLKKVGVNSYIDLVKEKLPSIAMTPWFKRAEKKSNKMSGVVPAMRVKRKNHKVDRVERLTNTADAYCMEVLGPNGEHDRHNFAVMTFLSDGSLSKSSIISTNCKYGDFFLYNDVSPEYGVVNAFPIPINEIEREEGFDREDPFAVRFRWLTLGNRVLENWEVTHMRLLGNDMFLPYGSSVIEPARRIWRQLILIEDAMMVYRVVRAPERRVFYIDVGNIPPENVPMYIEEQRKNLKTQPVVENDKGRIDLRYNPLSVDEDYFIPVRGADTGTKIDTLAGGQNTAAVEDVEYIQKKMFAAIKIPRAYLGYEEMLSSKATLAQEDIRFSRTINVIQKTVIAELNKLAVIHLFAHGFDGDDLVNFTLRLSNPSTIAQQQKLELWRAKFDIAGSTPEGMLTKEFVQQEIFGLNADQIKHIEERRLYEAAIDAAIEAGGAEAGGGGGGGGGGGADLFGGGGGAPAGGDDMGGGAEDLGGDLGGDVGGGEEPAAEEPADDELEAGEEPAEDSGIELLLAAEIEGSSPVNVSKHSKKVHQDYTKKRRASYRQKHGSNDDAVVPNFNAMTAATTGASHTKAGAKQRSTDNDIFGADTFRQVASSTSESVYRETVEGEPIVELSGDMISMLAKMASAFGMINTNANVLSESVDSELEGSVFIGDEDDDAGDDK